MHDLEFEFPLTDRGDRRAAAALRAALDRTYEIRYDFVLIIVRRARGRLAHRIGRPQSSERPRRLTSMLMPNPPTLPSFNQPSISSTNYSTAAATPPNWAATAMTPTELAEFLDDELTSIIVDDIADSA